MDKITLLTPTFNRAHTLPRVFEALKKQTFKDFCWVILDDGSTDPTAEVVNRFKKEALFKIIYRKGPNRHKFLTVLDGIKAVETPYFMVLDSDDSYPEIALEILFKEAEKLTPPDDYIAIMGLSADENGKVVGDRYPGQGFDGSIFEMRYKHKVRGDKFGLFLTKNYHREIAGKDFSRYEGKGYIPQSILFNEYDAKGLKTRFINEVVRYYLKDDQDAASVSNTRWSGQNVYGLAEGHLSFLNCYGKKLLLYPVILLKNLVGYQLYALKSGKKLTLISSEIKSYWIKSIGIIVLFFSFIYKNLHNGRN